MRKQNQRTNLERTIQTWYVTLSMLIVLLVASIPLQSQTNVKRSLGAPQSFNFEAKGGKSDSMYISGENNSIFKISTTGSHNEWCTSERVGSSSDIIIKAEKNSTPFSRQATVLVEVISKEGKKVDDVKVQVIQEGTIFNLDKNEVSFKDHGINSESININANGNWNMVKDETNSRAKWLKINPDKGTGNKRITISVDNNNTIFDRKAEVLFCDNNGNEILLIVSQEKSSTLPITSYEPLGAGYDMTGAYVTEIKRELFDINKLIDDDLIRIQTINSGTKAIKESEKGFQSMVAKMSNTTEIGVDGKAGMYTGSVKVAVGYKKGDSISSEQEYAAIIEQYRKADVQIAGSLSATDLKPYLTVTAAEALNNKNIDPQKIIMDYGTHAIIGFILGGSYNYWMSANTYNTASTASFLNVAEVAVGYQKDSTKSVNVSIKETYESYKSNKSSDFHFHEYLEAKGGESQYVSLLKSNFDLWQKSLEKKWSIIDFSGTGIIPLWEFVNDPGQKKKLKDAIEKYIKEGGTVTEYVPRAKILTIEATEATLHTTAGILERKTGILMKLRVGDKYILDYPGNLNFNENKVSFKDKKIEIPYKSTEDKTVILEAYGETANTHNRSFGKLELKYNKDKKLWVVNNKNITSQFFNEDIHFKYNDGTLKYEVKLRFTIK